MQGNVKEWVQDWHADYPAGQTGALVDPSGPASGSCRVFRGGSWKVEHDSVFECGFREFAPDLPFVVEDVGFRCAAAGPSL
jgi:formylglycine-generating enzyme required for sulfatase activity